MVHAVGSGLVRNKQNSGGQRTGQEYMNDTMCAWMTSQMLVLGVRTCLIDISKQSSVNEMVFSTLQLDLLRGLTNWLVLASICYRSLMEARFGIRRELEGFDCVFVCPLFFFLYFFNLILLAIFSLYVPCVGVEGEKCKFLVGCWLSWLPCKFHKRMYLQIFFPLWFINSFKPY